LPNNFTAAVSDDIKTNHRDTLADGTTTLRFFGGDLNFGGRSPKHSSQRKNVLAKRPQPRFSNSWKIRDSDTTKNL